MFTAGIISHQKEIQTQLLQRFRKMLVETFCQIQIALPGT